MPLLNLIRTRIHSGAWALFVILVILLIQNALSVSLSIGQITPSIIDQFISNSVQNRLWQVIKILAFVPALAFWLADRRKLLTGAIILSNGLLTFELFFTTVLMVSTLDLTAPAGASGLILDTVLVGVNNVLSFSLWYWLMDAPHARAHEDRTNARWDLLFPQRANTIRGYESWYPVYSDYLFLALITATTFGPADTVPLSRRAKILMGMQVIIAFVTISVLAARALSILTN